VTQFQSLKVKFPLGHIGKVRRVALPLRVAYASTMNAGQGITADTVIFVLSKIFARGLLYTVASRARTSTSFFTVPGPVQKEDNRIQQQTRT
jgi:ATP-dependent exoDNAse (exonuclease V) alpha subunit